MPQLDIRRTYADGANLLKQDLDAFIDDIETFLNLTKLNDDNFQDGGITGSTKLADGTVTNEKFTSSSIATAKINDGAVTTAKIADETISTTNINAAAVTSAKIAAGAITTAKIADANVTDIKHAVNIVTGSDAFTSNNTDLASSSPAAAASVTITASGNRPVLVVFSPDSNADFTIRSSGNGSTYDISSQFVWRRTTGSTTVYYRAQLGYFSSNTATTKPERINWPCLSFIDDAPAAGTYTYYLYIGASNGTTTGRSTLVGGRLIAMEF